MSAKQAKQTAPGRRERRRAETREKLFQAAMQLFAERGFFATTTEDITEAADVGQGTFFNYFPTKQHVLCVLSEKQSAKVMAAREEAEAGDASMQDVLHRLMHRIAEEPGRSQALTRSLVTALISNDDVRELIRNTMARGREVMAEIIALGQERGEIRTERNPAEIALAFQRGVIGTLVLWAMQSDGDLYAWVEAAFRDFWAATGTGDRFEVTDCILQGQGRGTRKPRESPGNKRNSAVDKDRKSNGARKSSSRLVNNAPSTNAAILRNEL
jgi:AcrR family transcriptional regulator